MKIMLTPDIHPTVICNNTSFILQDISENNLYCSSSTVYPDFTTKHGFTAYIQRKLMPSTLLLV